MNLAIRPGKYVIAVSGGVDSMVLLDLATKTEGLEIVVAHFDHGIHDKSAEYREFVANTTKNLGLDFAYGAGDLGSDASEDTARTARYKFLNKIKADFAARAVLTAHHQDDLIETVLINMIRGTGRKGLISLGSSSGLIRPLLQYSKVEILEYANQHKVAWREDPTNQDEKYLRNYLRLKVVPKMNREVRSKLLNIIEKNRLIDDEVAEIIKGIIGLQDELDRNIFNRFDHKSSKEVLADFLRCRDIAFDSKLLEKCVNFIKTALPGKKFEISKVYYLEISRNKAKLIRK